MNEASLAGRIEAALGRRPTMVRPLHGGCIAEVLEVTLDDGGRVVAKRNSGGRAPSLELEGWMLTELRQRSMLPVPEVLEASPDLLLISHIDHQSHRPGPKAQAHLADLLADLHEVSADAFGLERDTLIGPLPQPNGWRPRWCDFFREGRLLHFGRLGLEAGTLPKSLFARLETLAGKLEALIEEPAAASLLHGDVWSGNVLVEGERIAGLVDPAIYFGHAEIELAFTTLFGPTDRHFFDRYHERRPIAPGFFEVRRDLYNLYPLLVHAHLFGSAYRGPIEATLTQHGC